MARHVYGVYGTSWTDSRGNLWYKIYGDNYKHDTLWTIAQHFYGNGTKYKILYELNKDKIHDPHWIYPNHTILVKKGTVPPKRVDPIPPPPPKPATWTGGDFMEDKPVVTVSKEEYIMGVYDMEINSAEYEETGCIILTPKFDDKSIRELSISTNEEHPTIDAKYFATNTSGRINSSKITSVEYSVSIGDTWSPIMPSNLDRITNEKLFVNSSKKAKLRFKADTTYDTNYTMLYADGIQVVNSRDVWGFDSDKQTVIIHKYDSTQQYTMDYVPLEDATNNPKKISITEATLKTKLKSVTEVFSKGTDANMKMKLQHSPYMDSEVAFTGAFDPNSPSYPVTVSVSKANFIDKDKKVITDFGQDMSDTKSIHLKNITNYADKSVNSFTAFDAKEYPVVEFFHAGLDLYFAEPFKGGSDIDNIINGVHGEGIVTVSYKYPEVSLKIKVVMRRTTDAYDNYVTPMLSSIRIDAKSIK